MKNKRQINAWLNERVHRQIAQDAERLGESPGGYLARIALCWFEAGAPPVTAYEARLLREKHNSSNTEGSRVDAG